MVRIKSKSKIKIIVALDLDGGIGNEGAVPWRIAEDTARFRRLTMGSPVVMGRRTWDSLPDQYRPLPGRFNIIVSRLPPQAATDEIAWVGSLGDALDLGRQYGDTVWVIGGEQIYRQALEQHVIDEIVATEVQDYVPCDVFFPDLSGAEWDRTVLEKRPQYNLVQYLKRTPCH